MKKLIALSVLLLPVFADYAQAWGSIKDEIYAAAKAGDVKTIERFIMSGYSIDTKDADGNTALCTASLDYNSSAYDLLIRYGANPNVECMKNRGNDIAYRDSNYDGYSVAGGIALGVGGLFALTNGGGGESGNDPKPDKDDERGKPSGKPASFTGVDGSQG